MRYKTKLGRTFDIVNTIFLILLCAITIYPFIYVLACSFSDAIYVEAGDVFIWPKGFTLDAYKEAFEDRYIWMGYLNSVIYTVGFTALEIFSVYCIAYPLSKKRLIFRNFFLWYFILRMFLGGGLIPNYLVASSLGLVNNRLSMIVLGLAKVWDILLVRNYLTTTIPESLEESALIDGSNEIQILFHIMLPLSLPILATIALFNAVDKWNEYMNAIIYLQDPEMHPIQVVLHRLLVLSQTRESEQSSLTYYLDQKAGVATIKHAVTIMAILPIIMVYPFLQKYFVKGIIIGAIKQ